MVVGFNHNVRYKDQVFHIQTEDSGLKSPHIITLLYVGGTILASKKTSYADISKVDNLEAVVEELMKEQHKDMLRSLKNGDFDERIRQFLGGKTSPEVAKEMAAPPEPASPTKVAAAAAPAAPKPSPAPAASPASPAAATPPPGPAKTAPEKKAEKPKGESLDDIILSYLAGDDK